jgi:hypothetical protein
MRKTILDSVIEEMRQAEQIRDARSLLLYTLQKRFRKVPAGVEQRIDETSHLGRLRAATLDVKNIASPDDLRL